MSRDGNIPSLLMLSHIRRISLYFGEGRREVACSL